MRHDRAESRDWLSVAALAAGLARRKTAGAWHGLAGITAVTAAAAFLAALGMTARHLRRQRAGRQYHGGPAYPEEF